MVNIDYCQKILSNIILTMSYFPPHIFIASIVLVLLIGFFILYLQLYKTRSFIRKILKNKVSMPKKVHEVASELGIADRIEVVRDYRYFSFCYGFINPRIVLSLSMIKSLTREELKAVLLHESYHLKNKDPLKILFSQITTSAFFFLPVLRDFQKFYALSKELAADKLSIRLVGINTLRSALIKALASPTPSPNGIALFVSEDILEKRVNLLTDTPVSLRLKLSPLRLLLSLTIVVLFLTVLNLPAYAAHSPSDDPSYFICPTLPQRNFSPANYSPNN